MVLWNSSEALLLILDKKGGMVMQLEKYVTVQGILRWEGGRIGGQKESVEIAAYTDNPIVRHPITGIPYIPGSSLKGKIRSLLELCSEKERIRNLEKQIEEHKKKEPSKDDKKEYEKWRTRLNNLERYKQDITSGEPCGCGLDNCWICRSFGPHKNTEHSLGPTRLIFRDAKIISEKTEIEGINFDKEVFLLEDIKAFSQEKGLPYAEVKSENIINRHTGRASDPRQMERVIDGTLFKVEIIIRVFDALENEQKIITDLLGRGLKLLEQDYLGGSGSRGYGKVKFYDMRIDGQPWKEFHQK